MAIGALMAERRTHAGVQEDLALAATRYRTVADFSSDWEYWIRPDGSFEYVSPSCETATGFSAAAFVERPELLRVIVVAEDREKWEAHTDEARRASGPCRLEFRIHASNGEVRWIEQVCSRVVADAGQDLGIRASNRNVTARKGSEQDFQRAVDENPDFPRPRAARGWQHSLYQRMCYWEYRVFFSTMMVSWNERNARSPSEQCASSAERRCGARADGPNGA